MVNEDLKGSTELGLQISIIVVALIITVVLSFLERSKKGRRFGVVIPIDFLKYDRFTYVYAAAFGCTSEDIIMLVFQYNDFFSINSIPKLVMPWVRVLTWMLIAFLTALKFYPLYAVVRCKRKIVDPLIGFFFTVFIFSIYVYRNYSLYKRVASQHQHQYVLWLLMTRQAQAFDTFTTPSRCGTLLKCLKDRLGLSSQIRGSPRIISTFVVAGMALYSVGLTSIYIYGLFNVPSLLSLDNNITHTQLGQHLKTALQVLDVSFYLSVAIAIVFMGVYIFVIYSNYQRDLERMQRGDYSFLSIKTRKTSSDSIVAASLRYAGFQIASLVWCYILLTLFLLFLCFTVAYTVVLPLKGDVPFTFFEPVIILLSLILIRQIIFRGQTILVRNFFLQEFSVGNLEDKPTSRSLGLDNRRVFNVLAYFAFFYHTILGLFAALNRSLIGLGIGLVAMARTDKCMLPVGFEQFDRGYSTYVGMIILEIHHRNPVVAVFCDIILSTKSQTNALLRPVTSPNTSHIKRLRETANKRHRRIQRRWQKAYTMINNPSVRREKRNIYKNCSPDDVKIEV